MLEDGIYHKLSFDDYKAQQPRENATLIKRCISESIKHALESEPRKGPTVAFDKGTAVHSIMEGRDDLVHEFPYPTRKSAGWQAAKDQAHAEGAVILPQYEYSDAVRAADAVMANDVMRDCYNDPGAIKEISILGTHEKSGAKTKIRADLYVPERQVLIDLKTTQSAKPETFMKQFFSLHYDVQAAFYMMQARQQGLKVLNFVFFVVESTAPFSTHVFTVEPEVIERATAMIDETLVKLTEARKTGEVHTGWPRYTPISLPSYLKSTELEF